MNSLLKFYLSQELIQKNEYITLKAKIDVMTMSNLMFQMRTAEHAIVTLLRSIDAGEASPRMFEVLGGLQKTMLDIMKHQTLHMMAAEENMKKLKRDIDIYGDSIDITPKDSKPQIATVNRGTRNLMRDIQSEINGEEIEETDFDSENQDEL
jgi:cell division GTPase FtsZ